MTAPMLPDAIRDDIGPLAAAFARVQAVPLGPPKFDDPADEYLTELMLEFFARLEVCARKLRIGSTYVFENLAQYLKPSLLLPGEIEEWLEQLDSSGRVATRGRYQVIEWLRAYLCWSSLCEQDDRKNILAVDPYEPLIQFFELGGMIWVDHGGFFEIYPGGRRFGWYVPGGPARQRRSPP